MSPAEFSEVYDIIKEVRDMSVECGSMLSHVYLEGPIFSGELDYVRCGLLTDKGFLANVVCNGTEDMYACTQKGAQAYGLIVARQKCEEKEVYGDPCKAVAVMSCGATVSNVYEAYEAGVKAAEKAAKIERGLPAGIPVPKDATHWAVVEPGVYLFHRIRNGDLYHYYHPTGSWMTGGGNAKYDLNLIKP